jgi:hypothetical protein
MKGKKQVTTWEDPIVAEVRRVREDLLAAVDYDLDKLCEQLRKNEAASGRTVVRRSRRPLDELPEAAA